MVIPVTNKLILRSIKRKYKRIIQVCQVNDDNRYILLVLGIYVVCYTMYRTTVHGTWYQAPGISTVALIPGSRYRDQHTAMSIANF